MNWRTLRSINADHRNYEFVPKADIPRYLRNPRDDPQHGQCCYWHRGADQPKISRLNFVGIPKQRETFRSEHEYFDEIQDVTVTKDMLELARHVVNQKAGDFEPEKSKTTTKSSDRSHPKYEPGRPSLTSRD